MVFEGAESIALLLYIEPLNSVSILYVTASTGGYYGDIEGSVMIGCWDAVREREEWRPDSARASSLSTLSPKLVTNKMFSLIYPSLYIFPHSS